MEIGLKLEERRLKTPTLSLLASLLIISFLVDSRIAGSLGFRVREAAELSERFPGFLVFLAIKIELQL